MYGVNRYDSLYHPSISPQSPGNLIEKAQSESALYDQKDDVAPPLKVKKVPKPETVGKGWFDFQVNASTLFAINHILVDTGLLLINN